MTVEFARDKNTLFAMRKQMDKEDIESKTSNTIDSNASAGYEYEDVLELIGTSS